KPCADISVLNLRYRILNQGIYMTAKIRGQAAFARHKLKGAAGHEAAVLAPRTLSVKDGMQTMPLDQIKPNPTNPKMHSGKQIRQIAIVSFRFTNPLLVDERGEIIA